MTHETAQLLKINDLVICPEAGEIRNSFGEVVRLGPVNMRILEQLVVRAGQVVLRNDLFEEVWANQVVSDDALTRCISDIRLELSKLSENCRYIETIPKRGYRWNPDVTSVDPRIVSTPQEIEEDKVVIDEELPLSFRSASLKTWISRSFIYGVALLTTASLSVWMVEMFSRPTLPIVVVMPTQSDPAYSDSAAQLEEQITEYLISLGQVRLLSKTAVQSRPSNPFPYFYHEFGARWLVESELRVHGGITRLSIVLVDARVGLVLFQQTNQFPQGEDTHALDLESAFEPLRILIHSP